MDCKGKTALITGGGTGIGRGIALALARRGSYVVLCGRRPQPLAAVAATIGAMGGHATVVTGDVTNPDDRQQMLEAAHNRFGLVHILFNNVGMLASGSLLQLNGPEIERAVATNLAAPIDLTRLALPDLMQTRGTVVFVGSTMSHVPLPYASLYSATKAGLHAFCTSLRYEMAPLGVHLLEAYPPTVATAMTAGMARKATRLQPRPENAEAAGERIVAALRADRQEIQWGWGEQWLTQTQRFAPHVLSRALATQRRHFAHIMTPEPASAEAYGKGVSREDPLPGSLPLLEQLAAMRAAHPLRTRVINGHRWSYCEAGDGGSVVLLLPGALGEADTSFQYILALQETHRVLSLGYPATLQDLAPLLESVDLLLQQLGAEQVHVVGGSYSGLVAQHLAARKPASIASLLLSNTGAPDESRRRRWQLATATLSRVPEPWLQRIMQAGIARFLPGASPAQSFWRTYFATMLPHWSKQAIVARLRLTAEMHAADNVRWMQRSPYTGPVLIVDAAADHLVSQEQRQALRTLYPQAQHHRIAGKGHAASLDEAEAYIQIYREFLCSLPVSAKG